MAKVIEDTKGKTRDLPIAAKLRQILSEAADQAGVDVVRVTSGGQAKKGTPGKRTGSTRHDLGNAADLMLEAKGKALSFTKAAELPVFEAFVTSAASRGATGIGAGIDYMGEHTIHVGFGKQLVWGAGGKAVNAPAWLKKAADKGWSGKGANAPGAGAAAAGSLSGSVGQGGSNIEADVVKVQLLLNAQVAKLGLPPLAVDGDAGDKTITAIRRYQEVVLGRAHPDGRVDVGGGTWKALTGGK
jgi:hypothetical protein